MCSLNCKLGFPSEPCQRRQVPRQWPCLGSAPSRPLLKDRGSVFRRAREMAGSPRKHPWAIIAFTASQLSSFDVLSNSSKAELHSAVTCIFINQGHLRFQWALEI